MKTEQADSNRRILLVDDDPSIHADFERILGGQGSATQLELFGTTAPTPTVPAAGAAKRFEIERVHAGDEAVRRVSAAVRAARPFALAFVDVRTPPDWDSVTTIERMWGEDPKLHAVLCTSDAGCSWETVIARLGHSDRLLILKKPFDAVEVQQIASALTEKWLAAEREMVRLAESQKAEQEARAYAASLVTVNRALETARAGAVAAVQAKSEFLANMSHEIRTPMIAILGHADLLGDEGLTDDERREHLETIRGQGAHLLSMLSDILDIAAIETGRLSVQTEPCAPREILDEVRERFVDRAGEKGLALELECAASVPTTIVSDPTRLRQVITHLVGNAIKFTEKGSVKISAAPEREFGGDPRRLQIVVEDTGVGITNEQRARLFQAFAQADGSLTRRHGGAGLGLVLSRRLAHMLGGDLDVESEPGRGSRFTLSLPLRGAVLADQVVDPLSNAVLQSPAAARAASPDAEALRGRVLLVEDVAATQRLYSLYLRRAGAEVDVAENGQVAVDRVLASLQEGRPYDLVLMDMQMPVLDGFSATRIMRQRGFGGPIVAVTAQALTGDREKCLAAGCDDYCAKPTEREHLVRLSREWIQRSVPPALPRTPTGARESEWARPPDNCAG